MLRTQTPSHIAALIDSAHALLHRERPKDPVPAEPCCTAPHEATIKRVPVPHEATYMAATHTMTQLRERSRDKALQELDGIAWGILRTRQYLLTIR